MYNSINLLLKYTINSFFKQINKTLLYSSKVFRRHVSSEYFRRVKICALMSSSYQASRLLHAAIYFIYGKMAFTFFFLRENILFTLHIYNKCTTTVGKNLLTDYSSKKKKKKKYCLPTTFEKKSVIILNYILYNFKLFEIIDI